MKKNKHIITQTQQLAIEGKIWEIVDIWKDVFSGKPLKYLVIHCTATPEGREVSVGEIEQWHRGPRDLAGGQVKYKGKVYTNRSFLPDEKLGGVNISKLKGRGWKSLGYSKLVELDGRVQIVTPYDGDTQADQWEITNGVAGENSHSRHFVYAGGVAKDGKTSKDTRTDAQKITLENMVKHEIMIHPELLVCGHYHLGRKDCPSFDVETWLEDIGVDEQNIYRPGK